MESEPQGPGLHSSDAEPVYDLTEVRSQGVLQDGAASDEESDDFELRLKRSRLRVRRTAVRAVGLLALGGVLYGSVSLMKRKPVRDAVLDFVSLGHADWARREGENVKRLFHR